MITDRTVTASLFVPTSDLLRARLQWLVRAWRPSVACVTIAEAKEVVGVVVAGFWPFASLRRRRRRELTLAGQFLVLQLVVVVLLLGIVGVISVRQSTTAFTTD